MGLKVAIQMDPIGSVDINADSTFRLALEAEARGHSLFYYHVEDLFWRHGRVMATGHDLTVRRVQGDHFFLALSLFSTLRLPEHCFVCAQSFFVPHSEGPLSPV